MRIGVSLEGSAGSRSGSGGVYSMRMARIAGGRAGIGSARGQFVYTTAANTNGTATAATQESCLNMDLRFIVRHGSAVPKSTHEDSARRCRAVRRGATRSCYEG